MFYVVSSNLSELYVALFPISIFSEPTGEGNYIINVIVNTSDVEALEKIWSSLNSTSFPVQLDNATEISEIGVNTGCVQQALPETCEQQHAYTNVNTIFRQCFPF